MPRRIIIIDDDDTCRFLYRRHFSRVQDIEIIAEFDNAEEALERITELRPDAVIVDYTLPRMSGAEFAGRLCSHPEIKVLIVTGHDRDFIKSMMKEEHPFDIVRKDWSEPVLAYIEAFCR